MSAATVLLVVGLLLTALGVGGIDDSVTDADLWLSTAASVIGLVMMWAGVVIIRANDE